MKSCLIRIVYDFISNKIFFYREDRIYSVNMTNARVGLINRLFEEVVSYE
jgi:hypothetical protein